MTDFRKPEELWDEDDDNEQTKVAQNPLSRDLPAGDAEQREPHEAGQGAGSLYDRLLAAGVLEEEGRNSDASSPIIEIQVEEMIDDVRDSEVTTLARDSVTPLRDSELLPVRSSRSSESGLTTLVPESELAALARESVEPLRDSELLPVGRDSEASALPTGAEPLRDSEIDRLRGDAAPPTPKPKRGAAAAAAKGELGSVVLGPAMSTRSEVTERISVIPKTHPLANSIAPTTTRTPSRPPQERSGGGGWQVVIAAVALLGLGIGVARYQQSREQASRAAASTPATAPAVVEPARAPRVEPIAVTQPKPEAVTAPALEITVPPPAEATEQAAADSARRRRSTAAVEDGAEASPEPSSSRSSRAPREASKGGLPTQPTREQVIASLDAVVPALTKCVEPRHGIVEVTLTVRSPGAVSYALVDGTFAGTPEGSCIARTVRQAKFPPFTDPFLRITYPFQL